MAELCIGARIVGLLKHRIGDDLDAEPARKVRLHAGDQLGAHAAVVGSVQHERRQPQQGQRYGPPTAGRRTELWACWSMYQSNHRRRRSISSAEGSTATHLRADLDKSQEHAIYPRPSPNASFLFRGSSP